MHLAGVVVGCKGPLTYTCIVRIGTSIKAGSVSTTQEQDETQTPEKENKMLLPAPVTINATPATPEAEDNEEPITTKPNQSIPSEEQTTDPETKPEI